MNYLAHLDQKRQPLFYKRFFHNKGHNNRKLTKGRLKHRLETGNFKGYVPNKIVHATKMLDLYKGMLRAKENKPLSVRMKNMEKIEHCKRMITKYQNKLNN